MAAPKATKPRKKKTDPVNPKHQDKEEAWQRLFKLMEQKLKR